jgi:hypothetical protein
LSDTRAESRPPGRVASLYHYRCDLPLHAKVGSLALGEPNRNHVEINLGPGAATSQAAKHSTSNVILPWVTSVCQAFSTQPVGRLLRTAFSIQPILPGAVLGADPPRPGASDSRDKLKFDPPVIEHPVHWRWDGRLPRVSCPINPRRSDPIHPPDPRSIPPIRQFLNFVRFPNSSIRVQLNVGRRFRKSVDYIRHE